MATHDAETVCPACGRRNELHANADGQTAFPDPGDFSICYSCASVNIFEADGDGLTVRVTTDDERAEALADPRIAKVLGWLWANKARRN